MKILISTKETQGHRDNDFSWTNDGEMLTLLTFVCSKDLKSADGPCGCNRSFTGVDSKKGSTTASVSETDITEEAILRRICEAHFKAWPTKEENIIEATSDLKRRLKKDFSKIQHYPIGTILEYRKGKLGVRGQLGGGK